MIPTASAVQGLEKENGDFAETTVIENEKPARSWTALRGPAHQLAVRMRIIRGPSRGAHLPNRVCLKPISAWLTSTRFSPLSA